MDLTKRFPSHPSEDILEEYVFRRLPKALAAQVEEHLLICPSCQQAVQNTDELIAMLKVAAAHPAASAQAELAGAGASTGNNLREFTRRAFGRNAAWAAALATACLAILVFWPQTPEIPVAPVTLSSFRGSQPVSMAPAGKRLRLEIDAPDLTVGREYHIEIVRDTGQGAWQGPVMENGGKLVAQVSKPLPDGVYWVRMYGATGELLREFGLRVQ